MKERKINVSFIASNKINLNAIAVAVANQIQKGERKDNDKRTKIY